MPRLTLFGGPVLEDGGARVPLSPYQGALVGMLGAALSRGIATERLIETLWESALDARSRHRLSQLVYAINRRTNGAPVITKSHERYRLSHDVRSDLVRFGEALDRDRWSDAVQMYGRGFLSGLRAVPSDTFGDWLDAARLRLRARIRERAALRWTEHTREGRWREAVAPAEALLALDPHDEEALRMLVRARAMSGRVEEARAVYESFAERAGLHRAEWEPQSETVALVDRVRSLRPGPYAHLEKPMVEADPRPPLTGRSDELASLMSALGFEGWDGLRVVVVRGEGGIGKTRLVEDAVVGAPLDGIRVLRGQSSEFTQDIPLNPILEAFTKPDVGEHLNALEDPWRVVLLALMPEFHKGPGPLPELPWVKPGSTPRRLFEALRQLFERLARAQPTIVFLDDFQWADETSVAALDHLRRRLTDPRMILVVAVRSESLERGSAVERFLGEADGGRGGQVEIHIDELSPESARRLVDEVATGPVSEAEREDIATLGGLNPFFIIELTLEQGAGRRLPRPDLGDLVPLPFSIRQVLEQRLAQLGPDSERALNTLSVFGRSTRGHELAQMSQLEPEPCVEALEQLQQFRLVKWSKNGFRVRHELIRHAVYSRLSPARRAWIHGEVARYLDESEAADSVGELALHYHGAGNDTLALESSLEAASRAEAVGAVSEALRFLRVARASTTEKLQETDLIGREAHLTYLHRDFGDAYPLLGLAAERFYECGRVEDALRAELERLEILSLREALSARDFLRELDRIRDVGISNDYWEVVANAVLTKVRILDRAQDAGRVREVIAEAEGFRGQGNTQAQCSFLATIAFNLYYGSPGKALDAGRQAVALAQAAGTKDDVLRSCTRLLVVFLHQGLFDSQESVEIVSLAHSVAKRSGDLFSRFNLQVNEGVWYLDIGEYERSLVALQAAEAVLEDSEARLPRLYLAVNRGELFLRTDEMEKARMAFERAQSFDAPGMPAYARTLVQAGLGIVALHEGDLGEARRMESLLPEDPPEWSFEPSLIIWLRSLMIARRGDRAGAIDYMIGSSATYSERFITSWVKVRLLAAGFARRIPHRSADAIARPAYEKAVQLGLEKRTRQLAGYLR